MAAIEGNKINLSMLIDFLLQKTYHELTVLSELLPRKPDIERKIEIVQFASRTRQQFFRLLALVKWAAGAKRVDKCQGISTYLDQQSMVFVDTADMLARMARETLVQARLPTFCLPAAVDVLTTGTYLRLPTCIRDKIVPPDPISLSEKNQTLQRLNQVIQHRLVMSMIPPQMASLTIADGCVTFHVDHEFEVSLTVMGDDPLLPWRLLSINILVQDIETGDGKPLVHPMQVNYIHQLVQSRLFQEDNPLVDLYNSMHSFCLSLQLQVLHFQAKQLINERWHDNVKIDNYTVGKSFTLSYWRSMLPHHLQQQARVVGNSLTFSYQSSDNPGTLSITHQPALPSDSRHEGETADKVLPSDLNIERLLMQTVHLQSITKLKVLLSLLSEHLNSKVLLDRRLPGLAIQTCRQATPSEVLLVAVDTRTGTFKVSLGDGEENTICRDMEKALNADPKRFPSLLGDVRCQLHLRKCRRSVSLLPVIPLSYIPLTDASRPRLGRLTKHHMFLKFKNHPNFFLVIEVSSSPDSDQVIVKYSLLRTRPVEADNIDAQASEMAKQARDKAAVSGKHEDKQTRHITGLNQAGGADKSACKPLFLAAEHITELCADKMTDFPGTNIKGFTDDEKEGSSVKRKHDNCDEEGSSKKIKTTSDLFSKCAGMSSYQAELGHIVCSCDGRIPFVALCDELRRHKIVHNGVNSEAAVGLCVEILHVPAPDNCKAELVTAIQENMISCILRFGDQDYSRCVFELYFTSSPFQDNEKPRAKRVSWTYEYRKAIGGSGGMTSVVQQFMDDWCGMCKLYEHALDLDLCIKDNQSHVRHMFRVESYTYKQLTLQYEPDRQNMVTLEWSVAQSQFLLSFGHGGSTDTDNPHRIMGEHLEKDFNSRLNLPYLMQILHETWKPLSAMSKLPTRPSLGVITRPLMAQRTFAVLPQSPTSVHLFYRPSCALEIHFKAKNLVSIRDASLSSVDPTKPKQMLLPITNLKQFLQLYIDDIAKMGGIPSRRASAADDEPPPSPPMDMDVQFPQPMPVRNVSSPIVPRPSPQPPPNRGYGASPSTVAHSPLSGYSSPSPLAPYLVHSPGMSPGGGQVPKYRQTTGVGPKHPTTPPRPLVARAWASTTPTILSHAAFTKLCSPVMSAGHHGNVSPLEMFMGSMFLKKHFNRAIHSEEVIQVAKADASRVAFKVNTLQCVLSVEISTLTTLRLNLSPSQPQDSTWTHDGLRILERFFESRVATPPYKANIATSFVRILTAPANILKDLIKLIKLEMNPDPSHKWRVEWCLSMPPAAPDVAPPGTPAVVLKAKIFIFIQLKRQQSPGGVNPQGESSVFLPLLYHPQSNTTQQADINREPTSQSSSSAAISAFLKRWNETPASKAGECTIYAAVLELVKNLVLPTQGRQVPGLMGV